MTIPPLSPVLKTAWVFIVAAAILLLFGWCIHRRDTQPAPIPPKLETRIESLKVMAPVDSSKIVQLQRAATTATVRAATLQAHVVSIQATADREHARGDSLAQRAAQADSGLNSSAAWHAAFDSRSRENLDLRQALDSNRVAVDTLQSGIRSLRAALTVATDRVSALDRVNHELETAVVRASECRVLGPIPCPSRAVTAVVAVGLFEGLRALGGHP